MELSTPVMPARRLRSDDVFEYTEFALNWREPLPPAKFGNKRFMWGCVALTALLVIVMAGGR
jgi:hypothetical protein